MRYEPPSPISPSDTTLFTLPSTDPHPPYDQIWSALFPEPVKQISKKAKAQTASQARHHASAGDNTEAAETLDKVKPHAATVLPPASSANALQILESATHDVVTALLTTVRNRMAGNKTTEHSQDDDDDADDDEEGEAEEDELHFSVPLPIAVSTSTTIPISHPPSDTLPSSIQCSLSIPAEKQSTLSQPTLQRTRRRYLALQRGAIAHSQSYVGRSRREAVEGFVRFLGAEFAM